MDQISPSQATPLIPHKEFLVVLRTLYEKCLLLDAEHCQGKFVSEVDTVSYKYAQFVITKLNNNVLDAIECVKIHVNVPYAGDSLS